MGFHRNLLHFFLLFLAHNNKNMKRLSFWAKHHPKLSWLIIIICQVLIYFAGMYIGAILEDVGIHIPISIFLFSFSIFLFFVYLYPRGENRFKQYKFQKTCDFIIGLATFACICFYYNSTTRITYLNNYQALHGSLLSKAKKDSSSLVTVALSKKEKRQELRKLKVPQQQYKQTENPETIAQKILYSVLILLGAFAGLLLVAMLSCSLSCSGSAFAGGLVGILGFGGIMYLSVHFISRVFRKHPSNISHDPAK